MDEALTVNLCDFLLLRISYALTQNQYSILRLEFDNELRAQFLANKRETRSLLALIRNIKIECIEIVGFMFDNLDNFEQDFAGFSKIIHTVGQNQCVKKIRYLVGNYDYDSSIHPSLSDLAPLLSCPNLTELDLSGFKNKRCSNSEFGPFFAKIQRHPLLSSLDFSDSILVKCYKIQVLGYLKLCPNITKVDLSGLELSDGAAHHLVNLLNRGLNPLQVLKLNRIHVVSNTKFMKCVVKALANNISLQVLSLQQWVFEGHYFRNDYIPYTQHGIGIDLWESVSKLSNLTSLAIANSEMFEINAHTMDDFTVFIHNAKQLQHISVGVDDEFSYQKVLQKILTNRRLTNFGLSCHKGFFGELFDEMQSVHDCLEAFHCYPHGAFSAMKKRVLALDNARLLKFFAWILSKYLPVEVIKHDLFQHTNFVSRLYLDFPS